jgi:hypothetical protein
MTVNRATVSSSFSKAAESDEQTAPERPAPGQDGDLRRNTTSDHPTRKQEQRLGAPPDIVRDGPMDDKTCDKLWFTEPDIRAEHLRGRSLKQIEIDRFAVFGIAALDLCCPWPMMADRVIFQPSRLFDFARHVHDEVNESNAFTIGVLGLGGLIDIVAWDPNTDRHAPWLGRAFALGEKQIWQPNLSGDPLPIWRSPMGWLRSGRMGLVILRRSAAPFYLRDTVAVSGEDPCHCADIKRMLTLQQPKIVVQSAQATG